MPRGLEMNHDVGLEQIDIERGPLDALKPCNILSGAIAEKYARADDWPR